MDHRLERPTALKHSFFSPGVLVLCATALLGLVALAARLLFGLSAVANLNNQYPWGLWTGIPKAGGVALAASGFTTAALGHIMHRDKFHAIVRPALLAAMIGYTFVALAVCIDVGRWYFIWHPIFMWNGSSALFEVGICVTIYLNVLYIEFLPVVCERFIGRVDLPGALSRFNGAADRLLRTLEAWLDKTMFVFIIAGVVLSTLHQSSLGTLMVISGSKMHPLWQTPILPLLFLLSAISVGFPMVILIELSTARSFGLKPRMDLVADLARLTAPLLVIYLGFKLGDMMIRETFVYFKTFNTASAMFLLELVLGVILPLRLFVSPEARRSPGLMGLASALVAGGVLLNRFDNFVIAYTPPYTLKPYFPALGEILITIGFVSIEILLFRAAVIYFPVVSLPDLSRAPRNKYALRG
jgi:Ni/Fe-hydrogenase subunit HybB-like protein